MEGRRLETCLYLQPVALCRLINHHFTHSLGCTDGGWVILRRSKASVAAPNQSACKWGGKHLFWVQVHSAAHGQQLSAPSPPPSHLLTPFFPLCMMFSSHSCTLTGSFSCICLTSFSPLHACSFPTNLQKWGSNNLKTIIDISSSLVLRNKKKIIHILLLLKRNAERE